MNNRIPNPKSVINSTAFRIWCEAVKEQLDNIENTMIRRIAESQRREFTQPPIIQGLAPIEFASQLAEKWFFPMIDIKDFCKEGLLFAPLSNTELEKLSGEIHTYRVENKRLPIKLVRSKIFFPLERRLSCHFGDEEASTWAKFTYLPDLSFPFLPYSRKFLSLELPKNFTSMEQKMIIEKFSPESLMLKDGRTGRDVGIANDLIPVWNVKSGNVTVGNRVSAASDGLYQWQPNANDSLYEGDTYIIHCARDIAGNPVEICMSGGKFVSEFRFHRLEYSIIKEIDKFPSIFRYTVIGNEKIDAADNFWYRNYLQTTWITEKDIVQFLELIPVTRRTLKLVKIEMVDFSENDSRLFKYDDRKFFDHMWYIGRLDLETKFDFQSKKGISMHFEFLKNEDDNLFFIAEDIMNYFTSFCKLQMPDNTLCYSYLTKKSF